MANRTDLKQSLWSVNVWLEQSAFVMKKLEGKFKVCICVNGVLTLAEFKSFWFSDNTPDFGNHEKCPKEQR